MQKQLPAEIMVSISIAKDALQNHPNHLLQPFYRREIYRSIDNTINKPQTEKMRAILDILATKRVTHFWKIPLFMVAEEEDDYDYWLNLPQNLIEKSIKLLSGGELDKDAIREEAAHLTEVNSLTGQSDESPYYHEWCSFVAAIKTLWKSLIPDYQSKLETRKHISLETTDEENYFVTDTAILACLAYTGGKWIPTKPEMWAFDKKQNRWITDNREWYFEGYLGTWDRNTSLATERRKLFWNWWLTDAIDEAWHQSHQSIK